MSEINDNTPFSITYYFLYPHFPSKARYCIFVRNNLTCSRAHTLKSFEFFTIWLRLTRHSLIDSICVFNLSPNCSDYSKIFDYLTSKVEHILSLYPFAEISVLGDFNVHQQFYLSSPFTDYPGEPCFNFTLPQLRGTEATLLVFRTALDIRSAFSLLPSPPSDYFMP